jgi:hypothetical protein
MVHRAGVAGKRGGFRFTGVTAGMKLDVQRGRKGPGKWEEIGK